MQGLGFCFDCPQSKIVSRFESINPINPRSDRAETRRNFSKANADKPRVSPSSTSNSKVVFPALHVKITR
jgi:hypothetical protein